MMRKGGTDSLEPEIATQVQALEAMRAHTDNIVDRIQGWQSVYGTGKAADLRGAMTKHEALADAANRLGQRSPNTNYSKALLCLAEIEKAIGAEQKQFHKAIDGHVVMPLKNWLKVECAETQRVVDKLTKQRKEVDKAIKELRAVDPNTRVSDAVFEMTKDEAAKLKNAPPENLEAAAKHLKFKTAHDMYEDLKANAVQLLNRVPDFQVHHDQCVKQMFNAWKDMLTVGVNASKKYIAEAKAGSG